MLSLLTLEDLNLELEQMILIPVDSTKSSFRCTLYGCTVGIGYYDYHLMTNIGNTVEPACKVSVLSNEN